MLSFKCGKKISMWGNVGNFASECGNIFKMWEIQKKIFWLKSTAPARNFGIFWLKSATSAKNFGIFML